MGRVWYSSLRGLFFWTSPSVASIATPLGRYVKRQGALVSFVGRLTVLYLSAIMSVYTGYVSIPSYATVWTAAVLCGLYTLASTTALSHHPAGVAG